MHWYLLYVSTCMGKEKSLLSASIGCEKRDKMMEKSSWYWFITLLAFKYSNQPFFLSWIHMMPLTLLVREGVSLKLSWPCDLLWLIEHGGSDILGLLSSVLKGYVSFCVLLFGKLWYGSQICNDESQSSTVSRGYMERGPEELETIFYVLVLAKRPAEWIHINDPNQYHMEQKNCPLWQFCPVLISDSRILRNDK